jgi:hypothetical protein|tara:strand:- start:5776 stop:6909 length:1134 start_codon:yes stop_codon:yes gene_type:complete
MKPLQFFLESGLSAKDAVVFSTVFQAYLQSVGPDRCWCLKKNAHSAFAGFSVASPSKTRYRDLDARPLALALAGVYPTEDAEQVLVRRSCCKSVHCINPAHYYYGSRADVAMETQGKKPIKKGDPAVMTPKLAELLRSERASGKSIASLAIKYRLQYHVARRVCSENAYRSGRDVNFDEDSLKTLWLKASQNCIEIRKQNPNATRELNISYQVTQRLTCPWHQKKSDKHKGNFGLMGECLDCMEELKEGRCSVDVTQFDMDWYWQVKRFWEQVDIKSPNECWPWLGPTRRNGRESVAYFPSPIHAATAQSASRVAFWLSRGYTGKYRVFSRKDCTPFCCNPLHLSLTEAVECKVPSEISNIKLNHSNVLQHYKQASK